MTLPTELNDIYVIEELSELKERASKYAAMGKFTSSVFVQNGKLPPRTQHACKVLYEDLGLNFDKQPLIQIKVSNNELKGFYFPFVCLEKNIPVLLFPSTNTSVPLTKIIAKGGSNLSIKMSQTTDGKSSKYTLVYKSPKDAETENFEFALSLASKEEAEEKWNKHVEKTGKAAPFLPNPVAIKMLKNMDYLSIYLSPPTLSFDGLEDGEYLITKMVKKDKYVYGVMENGMRYFFREYHYEQHKKNGENEKPTYLVVQGTTISKGKTYKKTWIKGFEPSQNLSKTAVDFAIARGDEEVRIPKVLDIGTDAEKAEASKPFTFVEPVIIPIKGIKKVPTGEYNPLGVLIESELNGSSIFISLNSMLKKAYETNTFNLKNFEGVHIAVHGFYLYGKNVATSATLHLPESCLEEGDAEEFASMLSF